MNVRLCVIALSALAVSACGRLAPEDFRNAVPEEEDLKVIMGSSDTAGALTSALLDPYAQCPDCCIAEFGGDQEYIDGDVYQMTRSAIWQVNGGLAMIFAWIRTIVAFPWSSVTSNGYVWGPWDDTNVNPLTRLSYRFVMTSPGGNLFTMSLEARNLNAPSEEDWHVLAFGEVTPAGAPHHGAGFLELDLDTLHAMDTGHPTNLYGRIRYDFDVSETEPTSAQPNTVTTMFTDFYVKKTDKDQPEPMSALYEYERYEELAGMLRFTTEADFAGDGDAPDGLDEAFQVTARWNENGRGIGEATVTGGSLPTLGLQGYTLTECWADSVGLYYQTYRKNAVQAADGTVTDDVVCGTESSCPVL